MQASTEQEQQVSPSNTTLTIPELELEIVHLPASPDTIEGIHKIRVINKGDEDFTGTVSLHVDDNLTFGDATITLDKLDFSVAAGETQEKEVELRIKNYDDTPTSSPGRVTLIFGFGDHIESTEMFVN